MQSSNLISLLRVQSPFVVGILFAILWSSASVAGKFGLFSAEPLVLFNLRFFGAAAALLIYAYGVQGDRMPKGGEWGNLALFGLLNTTLYLGLFVLALSQVTPGITTLAVALNPLFISILSALWAKHKVLARQWVGIGIGLGGVFIAAYPHLETDFATPLGLVLLACSQLAYSLGAVYYSAIQWGFSRTTINAWQVLLGGVFLLPATLIMHRQETKMDLNLVISLAWLIIPVSVIAVQLWLRLVKIDTVRASMWLYLCPIFGFLYASVLLGEPLHLLTFVGTGMVLGALYLGQK